MGMCRWLQFLRAGLLGLLCSAGPGPELTVDHQLLVGVPSRPFLEPPLLGGLRQNAFHWSPHLPLGKRSGLGKIILP